MIAGKNKAINGQQTAICVVLTPSFAPAGIDCDSYVMRGTPNMKSANPKRTDAKIRPMPNRLRVDVLILLVIANLGTGEQNATYFLSR